MDEEVKFVFNGKEYTKDEDLPAVTCYGCGCEVTMKNFGSMNAEKVEITQPGDTYRTYKQGQVYVFCNVCEP